MIAIKMSGDSTCASRILLIMFACCQLGYGANILIFAGLGEGSHFLTAGNIGNGLIKRGHNVTALISNAYSNRAIDPKFKDIHFEIFKHNVPPEAVHDRMMRMTALAFKGTWLRDVLRNLSALMEENVDDCRALFSDEALLRRLKEVRYDVAIVDPVWQCSLLVGEYAAKRHVSMMSTAWIPHLGRVNGNPSNPAYVSEMAMGFTNQMTFMQRTSNFLMCMVVGMATISTANAFVGIQHEHGICPHLQTSDLFQRSQLVLANVDFAVEFPVPLQPHVKAVGGLSTEPAKRLDEDLEEFVQSSGDAGIIIFSLGTYVSFLEERLIAMFADSFSKLPQKVVWQLRGTPPAVLEGRLNIKIMNWLPQNDLLGHNKTRVFVYQGGNNGLYEAVYHAVPLIVIPLLGDQFDVAARVKSRGIGQSLDIKSVTTENIVSALSAVINDHKYKETARRVSATFHSSPMKPVESAVFWIEHLIDHGGEYMRPPIHDLTTVQYLMLDVVAFLLSVVVIALVALVFTCRFSLRCCKRLVARKKAKSE
ncbi:UDP-glucuronosyltransferase 2A3-like [Diadema antillarum]|uniref:UDP-glucuronosyltransferase 2A3-like n=1 Tax=Diadema antillarum TaxID=105358 RepID=UPI003A8599D5